MLYQLVQEGSEVLDLPGTSLFLQDFETFLPFDLNIPAITFEFMLFSRTPIRQVNEEIESFMLNIELISIYFPTSPALC